MEVLQQVNVIKIDPCEHQTSSAPTTAFFQGRTWQHNYSEGSNSTSPHSLTWQQFKAKSWLFSPKLNCNPFKTETPYNLFQNDVENPQTARPDQPIPNSSSVSCEKPTRMLHLLMNAAIPLPDNTESSNHLCGVDCHSEEGQCNLPSCVGVNSGWTNNSCDANDSASPTSQERVN